MILYCFVLYMTTITSMTNLIPGVSFAAASSVTHSSEYASLSRSLFTDFSDHFSEADTRLLEEVQRRAFLYFWERADAHTGLVTDRARNKGADSYEVASIAATGYALAALPIGVEHGWVTRAQGRERALLTLDYLVHHLDNEHGWFYHFMDWRTGKRVWKSEISSMDTALLLVGALTCGQYFQSDPKNKSEDKNEVAETKLLTKRVSELYGRVDWTWMRTCGGRQPAKLMLSHGWKPEKGFLPYNWDRYSEAILLYLLGLGASVGGGGHVPLPEASWQAWSRNIYEQDRLETLTGGPLFLHQMAHGFYDFRGKRDSLGYDYWVSAQNAMEIHRQFCRIRAGKRKTYALGFWGLNASDSPKGYTAYGLPAPEDGTVSPNGVIAGLPLAPAACMETIEAFYKYQPERVWGRYGFVDALNVDKNWLASDVIGIDLGMALIAIENQRTGLIWKLVSALPSTARAYQRAGLHTTHETQPRLLRLPSAMHTFQLHQNKIPTGMQETKRPER